jgi:SnoaL-like protein
MRAPAVVSLVAAGAVLTLAAGSIVVARGADDDLSTLQQRVDRLDALTERVEAISSITRLQHAYGHYAELGLWHDFADLFADTGIGHYTQGALDREAIRSLFLKEVGGGRLGLADGRLYPHISMQPVVTLAADGQSGKGRWHIMAMLGGFGGSASWAGGVYENQYMRENGVWKFKEVRYLPQYSGRYEDPGWKATNEPTPFHFDASRVGKPILDSGLGTRGSGLDVAEPPTLAALAKRMADLSARAQRLSDEIEVTNLQHAYGYYVDRKMWDDVAELFAADGTMELGLSGVYAGRASIRRGLNAFGPAGLAEGGINDHIQLQTIVTVLPDGRTARARGTEIGMTGTSGKQALWSQSIYENEFVKEEGKSGGVWRFKTVHVYPRFIVDAEKGWAKDAQPAPGPSREFPPDRPPSETYEIYPRFHIAPFHFDHPVTGRPPEYPEGTTAFAPVGRGFQPRRGGPERAALRTKEIASLLAATERSVERSKAYHASENLATAYGYYIDEFAWDEMADIFSRRLEGALLRRHLRRPRTDPAVAEAAVPERQIAQLPHGAPGRAASHPRVRRRAEREDSCAAVSVGRSGGRRGILDLRDLREHDGGRRRHLEAIGHGPRLRVDGAVTRRMGPRQDATHRAGGRDD